MPPHLSQQQQQGYANPYPQRMPFPSPFDAPSMGVFNPAASGGPSNFTQMQTSQKKRPKYTRSKAGCLTCRHKKIKVRLAFFLRSFFFLLWIIDRRLTLPIYLGF